LCRAFCGWAKGDGMGVRLHFTMLCVRCSIEYNVSYVYHALYAYFDRDNVGLPGFAAYFKAASLEEREHAEILMEYQNLRGGRVKLQNMMMPEAEFNHAEKVGGCSMDSGMELGCGR
jgi:ferritin